MRPECTLSDHWKMVNFPHTHRRPLVELHPWHSPLAHFRTWLRIAHYQDLPMRSFIQNDFTIVSGHYPGSSLPVSRRSGCFGFRGFPQFDGVALSAWTSHALKTSSSTDRWNEIFHGTGSDNRFPYRFSLAVGGLLFGPGELDSTQNEC